MKKAVHLNDQLRRYLSKVYSTGKEGGSTQGKGYISQARHNNIRVDVKVPPKFVMNHSHFSKKEKITGKHRNKCSNEIGMKFSEMTHSKQYSIHSITCHRPRLPNTVMGSSATKQRRLRSKTTIEAPPLRDPLKCENNSMCSHFLVCDTHLIECLGIFAIEGKEDCARHASTLEWIIEIPFNQYGYAPAENLSC